VNSEILTFDLKDVEDFLYPIACEVFDQVGYVMPKLEWHDRSRMDAALNAVKNGDYEDILHAAAALAYYVNKGHALKDGNKRMTVVVLYSFLMLNGYIQKDLMTYDDVVTFTEKLASSESTNMESVVRWIRDGLSESMREMTPEEQVEILDPRS
jgi:death-on-curing family protein